MGGPPFGGDDPSGETIGTLALSGAAHVGEHGAPQESGTDDPLEVSGDLAAENVAPLQPVGSQIRISRQSRRCGNKTCVGAQAAAYVEDRMNGVDKMSGSVMRKCTSRDQEVRREVTCWSGESHNNDP